MSRSRIAAAALLLAALLAAAALLGGAGESWVVVERRPLTLGAPATGVLEATESERIGPPQLERMWNFQISRIAPDGSEVKAGQPVLAFDSTELEQQLRHAMAEAEAAAKELEKRTTDLEVERRRLELRLEEARARLRRAELKSSTDDDLVSRSELRKAEIDRELAQLGIDHLSESLELLAVRAATERTNLAGKLELVRARVERLRHGIERMTVEAARDGTVIHKSQRRGEKRAVGESVHRAETVLEIPDLSRMQGIGEVDEAYAGRLAEGQEVTFRLDAYPDIEYRGRIERLHRTVQRRSFQDPRKVIRFTLELAETDTERMRPGMRFQGTVVSERVAAVPTVPHEAVRHDERGSYVVVRRLAGRSRVYPELGRHDRERAEVVGGLEPGDRVLVDGDGGVDP